MKCLILTSDDFLKLVNVGSVCHIIDFDSCVHVNEYVRIMYESNSDIYSSRNAEYAFVENEERCIDSIMYKYRIVSLRVLNEAELQEVQD